MSTNQLREAAGGERAVAPLKLFSNFMDKLKPQLELALPKHLNQDRMARLALTAFSNSQALQRCSHQSIAASIMTAAQLGLEPGVNGAGYLIPYGQTCTFVPGWKGLVDLVSRSGRGTVFTGVIFKDQEFSYTDGARRDLVIHNQTDLDDPVDITHAFAVGWVKGATMPIIELWSVKKIEKHRDKYNKVGKKHYSYRDWEMYCRKVPLLQVLKYMPCSVELANAIEVSHSAEAGKGVTIENGIILDMDGQVGEQRDMGTAENVTVNESTGEITPDDGARTDPGEEDRKASELAARKAAQIKKKADEQHEREQKAEAERLAAQEEENEGGNLPDDEPAGNRYPDFDVE